MSNTLKPANRRKARRKNSRRTGGVQAAVDQGEEFCSLYLELGVTKMV
jgi:undecaprenyl pyrophosphate synthase